MNRNVLPRPTVLHGRRRAVLAVACALACAPAWAADGADADADATESRTTTLDRLDVTGERAYTVEKTTAGTRMDLSLRQIPQSVTVITRDRIDDQDLQSIGAVLENVTGVSGTHIDSERYEFYARGFYIDSFQFDGIPTTLEQPWNYSDSSLDLALYERVEIVRGATGLLSGAGNPSASVNLVRKHADSRELAGSVAVGVGSWGKLRTTVDLTTPLNPSGSIRARVVGNYTESESHVDRYAYDKTLGYAVLDADLGEATTLSVGYDRQEKNTDGVTWGGFPMWYSDGGRTDYPASFNPATDWTYWNTSSKRAFAGLEHGFGNGWDLKVAATRDRTEGDSKLFYPYYTIYGLDRDTGGGVIPYSGWYVIRREVTGADAYADGPFRLFGREHELVLGLSGNRREYVNTGTFDFPFLAPIPDYRGWDGSQAAEPAWLPLVEYGRGTITQKAAYGAARLSLADPLTLVLGARRTAWESEGENNDREHEVTTPYAGLVWDLGDAWSAYASYTDIFQPQTNRGASGDYLDPVTGKSYEAGVKAAWFGDRLNAQFALFRIEQDNVAQPTGTYLPDGQQIYTAARGTVSEGFDFELSGRLAEGLNATFGASHYTARDADGSSINKHLPRTTIKLFASWTPQGAWDALTVGGGINWQNRIYYVDPVYGAAQQDGYALVGLFARYRIAPQFSVQANIDNLLDKDYYSQINSGYGAWGAPRSGSLTFAWSF